MKYPESEAPYINWMPCLGKNTCMCYYGIGGKCQCSHPKDMHDDCSMGFFHCHAPKVSPPYVAFEPPQ